MWYEKNKRHVLISGILGGLVLAFAMMVFQEGSAYAEGEGFVVGKWAHQRLTKAHEAIGKKQYNKALELLNEMQERKRLNDHEKAMMWQTYGFVWSSKGKFPKAIQCFKKCIELNAMPEMAMLNMEFNLGQLYMAIKEWHKAVAIFREWLKKVDSPAPHSLYMIAMGYAQIKKYKHALYYAKKAIAGSKKPQESWYQFVLSMYFRYKKYQQVAEILELLVTRYSKKNYWVQLASVYSQLKKDKEALAVMQLAHMQNFLTRESEIVNLASLYMHNRLPIKAAEVVREGMKTGIVKKEKRAYKMLAESLIHARETKRAVEPLRTAAKMEKKGDLYVQLAQLHVGLEEWAKAIQALNLALQKGKLTNPGTTYLLMGMCKNNLNQYRGAISAFNMAKKHKQTKDSATQWINIVKGRMRGG